MGIKQATLQNIAAELDNGKIQTAFAKEMERVLKDCLNRPSNKKKRTVTLVFSVMPEAHEGQCESIRLAADIKSSIPARTSTEYPLGININGQAWFTVEDDAEMQRALQ